MIKKFYKICVIDGAVSGWLCLLTTISLLVAAFCVPPVGLIDSSVLVGTSILFAFATLTKLPNIILSIKDGKSLRLNKGDLELEIKAEKEKKDE